MSTYSRSDLAFVRGEGIWLFDQKGKMFLDLASGIAVNSLGHCHPKLVETLIAIRILYDENEQNPVKAGEIKKYINRSKKQEITSAANTGRLKRLKEIGIIESHEKARYSLNVNGLLLSGLFIENEE